MDLLIYGAGGFAREVQDMIVRNYSGRWKCIYFIDDYVDEGFNGKVSTIKFSSVKRMVSDEGKQLEGVVAVGEPKYRELLTKKLNDLGIEIVDIIDKTAIISPTAKVGKGVIICPYSTIHTGAEIGNGVLIQPGAVIGHDIVVGEYSVMGAHCSPGGNSHFGKRVYVGMNAAIKENLDIGDDVVIGMGAVVFQSIEAGNVVIGNPARITRGNSEHTVFRR